MTRKETSREIAVQNPGGEKRAKVGTSNKARELTIHIQ